MIIAETLSKNKYAHWQWWRTDQPVDKFTLTRHFATLHSGFYSFSPIKAGMERSEITDKPFEITNLSTDWWTGGQTEC